MFFSTCDEFWDINSRVRLKSPGGRAHEEAAAPGSIFNVSEGKPAETKFTCRDLNSTDCSDGSSSSYITSAHIMTQAIYQRLQSLFERPNGRVPPMFVFFLYLVTQ